MLERRKVSRKLLGNCSGTKTTKTKFTFFVLNDNNTSEPTKLSVN